MKRSRLIKSGALLAVVGVLAVLTVAMANAAMVRVGDLVLRADGGFTPRELPRRSYAPIHFQGHVNISSAKGGLPPAADYGILYFDRDGKLFTRGLPICPRSRIETASPAVARRLCGGAIVGEGHIGAAVALPGGGTVKLRSLLTVFNGPRENGNATVIVHAQAPAPVSETYAVVVPIERRQGPYGYKVTIDVPPIAGGAGTLTHLDGKIGREFRSGGAERSYVSARCLDGILETRGHFLFSDSTVIDGVVYKPCTPLP